MAERNVMQGDFLKFLGTAGARFVMIKQLRHSGGIWVSSHNTNVLIDPGPGSLVRCLASRPKLDPSKLDAIILTHRHIDHCNDVNVMIEAMTEGGHTKRGAVFCPADALEGDPVVFKYSRAYVEKVVVLEERTCYREKKFAFQTSMHHIHPSLTFGLKFKLNGRTVGLMTDTRSFKELKEFYKVHTLIMSVVFPEPRPGIDHLSLVEAADLIKILKPKRAILTHFGMRMLAAKPHLQARRLTQELGIEIIAATDGMTIV
ncbi:MAG: MBL fold metallo-hydrolase [Candidatus Omnitrophica bacterium]|nr:MBL fold metallo-hydrolase [Candidatus Omnitrophota bacterium]